MSKHETVADDFPTPYLTWEDIDGLSEEHRTVTIERCEYETVRDMEKVRTDANATKQMRVIYFKGAKKGLGLCKTNAYAIAFLLENLTYADWVGGTVTLIVREYRKGEKCIRIKMPKSIYDRVRRKCAGNHPWIGGPA